MRSVSLNLACLASVLMLGACSKPMNPESTAPLTLNPPPAYHYVLPNGLTLLVVEDHSAPVVSVQAWCAAGSITEGPQLGCGQSHILEHMLFKGTARRGNSEIAQTVQNAGGYINAYTSFDRTVFHINLPSRNWQTALDVLSDAVFHSTLPEAEFAKEQEVIRHEFAMGEDDPDREISRLLFATAYAVHPYKYPVIGYHNLYDKLTRQSALDYYHKFYVPNNLTFVLAGDVSAPEVKSELQRLTADIPRQNLETPYIPAEPPQLGRREAEETFPTDATRMMLAWHIPGITSDDLYALDVLSVLAGDGASARFHRELVERQKLLRGVDVGCYAPAQSGLWIVSTLFNPGGDVSPAKVETEVMRLLHEFQTAPVSAEELGKARRKALASRAGELKTAAGLAASLGNSWFAARDLHFSETYLQRVQQITAEDLQRVARKYFTEQNLTCVRLLPASAKPVAAVTTVATARQPVELIPFNSGLHLVFQQSDRTPLVTVRATVRGGLLAEAANQAGIGNLAGRLLGKGTATRSAEQLAAQIEDLGGSFSTESGNNTFSIAIEVLEPDVDKAVELLADMLLHSTFSETELEKERSKQLADIRLESDEPLSVARNAMRHALYEDHPYGRNPLGTPETLSKLQRQDLLAFHQRLLRRDAVVFSAGGKTDRSRLLQSFEHWFPASAFSSEPSPASPDVTFHGNGQTVEVPTPKEQAIVEIGYPSIPIDSPDRAALDLANEALSDLASRLFIRIREKQSLAYFVGTSQMPALKPGYFLYYAGTGPENANKVRSELLDEIANMVKNGLTPREISRARAKLLGKRLLQDQSASVVAYKAALNVLYGLGLDQEDKLNQRISALSDAEINDTLRRYFAAKNYVCVIVKPATRP